MINNYRIGLWFCGILYTVDVKYDHLSKGSVSYPLKADGIVSLTFDRMLSGIDLDELSDDEHIIPQVLGKIEQILQARSNCRKGIL